MRAVTDVSAAWVARAVEDNEAEFLLALATSSRASEREQEFRFVVLDRACGPGGGHLRHVSHATSRDDEASEEPTDEAMAIPPEGEETE